MANDSSTGLDPGSAISFAAPAGRRSIDLNLLSIGHKLQAWNRGQSEENLGEVAAVESMLQPGEDAEEGIGQQKGVPSSEAFAAERAADSARWAGLGAETRNAAIPLATQLKADFITTTKLLSQPPGPSSATRSISRSTIPTRSSAIADIPECEQTGTPSRKGKEKPIPLRTIPVILPGTAEVSTMLHLIAAPAKVGGKDKETAPNAATRANNNNITLGSHIIALRNEAEKAALNQVNDTRRLAGDFANLAALHAETTVTLADLAGDVKDLATTVGASTHDHTTDGAPHDLVMVRRHVSHLEKATRAEFQTSQEDQAAMTNAILQLGQRLEAMERRGAQSERDQLAVRATLASLETQAATAAIAAVSSTAPAAAPPADPTHPARTPTISTSATQPSYPGRQASYTPQYMPPRTGSGGRGRGAGPDPFTARGSGQGNLKRSAPDGLSVPPPPKRGPAVNGGMKKRSMFPILLLMSPVSDKLSISPQDLFAKYASRAVPMFPLGNTYVDFYKGSRNTLSIGWALHVEAKAFLDAWQGHGENYLRHVVVRWGPVTPTRMTAPVLRQERWGDPLMDVDVEVDEELQLLAGVDF